MPACYKFDGHMATNMRSRLVNVFIIDDDKILSAVIRREITNNFPNKDLVFHVFSTGEMSLPLIKIKPDIAIIDYYMNSRVKSAMNGIEVIDIFRQRSPGTDIILLTQDDNIGLAVEALTHGAKDYVVKNEYMLKRLNVSLYQCFELWELKDRLQRKTEIGILALVITTLITAFAFVSLLLFK